MENTIRIGIKEPGKTLEIKVIKNETRVMQAIVGGYLEVVSGILPDIAVVFNEGEMIETAYPNFMLLCDFIIGTAFFTRINRGEFVSIEDGDIAIIRNHLSKTSFLLDKVLV